MRILLKTPETRVAAIRNSAPVFSNIEALYNSVLKDARQFEVRCYRAPYSIRGRRIGDHFLEVGWLTPDFGRDTAYGSSQCSPVYLDPTIPGGGHLLSLFERTFTDLWEHPDTVDGATLLNQGPA